MADYGMKVLKKGVPITTRNPRDFFLKSENVLLKIHKQGSFKARYLRFNGVTVTIRYDDLGYRPIVLVYCQRKNSDGTLDPTYHLMDWEYHGATQEGWQRVKIFSDHFEFNYVDQDPDVDGGASFDVFGYYYVFKEEAQ